MQATSRYLLRVFGPGPTRIGVSSAHSTPAVMTSARISMFTPRTAFAARAIMEWTNPSDGRVPVSASMIPRAPLDRDVVHDQQEHAPGLQVRPVGDGAGLPGPGRRRRGMDLPAAARHRVLVVLRDRRGDRGGVDDLVRRGHAEVVRVREVPAAAARALREQRLPVVRVLAPGQVRAGGAGLLALPFLPAAALRPRLRRRSSRAGHRPTAASRSSPSSATPPAQASPAAPTGPRPAPSARRSAFPGSSISTPWSLSHHGEIIIRRNPVTAAIIPAAARRRHANPPTAAKT